VALAIVDAFAKFKEHGFIHSKNTEGGLKFQKVHVTQTTPFQEKIFIPGVGLAIVNPLAKFNERSFTHSRNIEGGLKLLKGSRDPDHAPLRGKCSPLG